MISPWLIWGGSMIFFVAMVAFGLPAQGFTHKIKCSPKTAILVGAGFGLLGVILFFLPLFIYK
jgi:hypothetical protein